MSSFVRRIERQQVPSRKRSSPRKKFFNGRGDKLGVKNPKCAALRARLAREARRAAAKT